MPNRTSIELNKSWICERLCHVTNIETKKVAWVLVQEPGFIGFGVASPNEICWPPYLKKLDWELVSDLRLFGEKGEWHIWRDWDGKHYARLLEVKNINDALTEYHVLWGTDVKCTQTHWVKLREERGAEIWIPPLKDVKLTEKDLPLRLELKQIVDYDPKYHLAGIVDAAFVSLVRKSCKEPLLPDLSLLCS